MAMPKHYFIVNLLIYQVCWFACVLGAANGVPWVGVIIVATATVCHLFAANKPVVELVLIGCIVLIGGLWDSFLVTTGWLQYPNGIFIDSVAPYWILSLWVSFAITLNVSLAWFKQRLWLASLFGGIGGPLAFFAGQRLGAVEFPNAAVALIALAAGWTLLMPLIVLLARRYDGFENSETKELANV